MSDNHKLYQSCICVSKPDLNDFTKCSYITYNGCRMTPTRSLKHCIISRASKLDLNEYANWHNISDNENSSIGIK